MEIALGFRLERPITEFAIVSPQSSVLITQLIFEQEFALNLRCCTIFHPFEHSFGNPIVPHQHVANVPMGKVGVLDYFSLIPFWLNSISFSHVLQSIGIGKELIFVRNSCVWTLFVADQDHVVPPIQNYVRMLVPDTSREMRV